MKRIFTILLVALLVIAGAFSFAACSGGNTIVIGTKDFGENILLGEIYAQLIEAKTDIKVKRKLNLGGTFVCFEAIKNGDIDIYPEYTGTGLLSHLKMDLINDADETYSIVKEKFNDQFDITWLKPHGFNNTYAVVTTEKIATEHNLKTISDLVPYASNYRFGGEHEFFDRLDGYEGLLDKYGLTFKGDPYKMNVALKYQAIGGGEIQVTDAFSTDAEIIQYNLKLLEDNLGFFPPYYAAPIIRNQTLEKFPQLEGVLNSLEGIITDEVMTQLNYQASIEKKSIESVANEFLKSNNLI